MSKIFDLGFSQKVGFDSLRQIKPLGSNSEEYRRKFFRRRYVRSEEGMSV